MSFKYYKSINLKIDKELTNPIQAKQGDSARYLLINIKNNDGTNFDLTDKTVRLYAIKPDGKQIFNDCKVIDVKNGQIEVQLTTQILAVIGWVKCELLIASTDNIKLSTMYFTIDVIATNVNTAAIESTNEFQALDKALEQIDQYNKYYEETSGKLEEKYTTRLSNAENSLTSLESNKRDKSTKIKSSELDTSSDENKVKLINCSDELIKAIAGTASVNPTLANRSITSEKYAVDSVEYDAILNQIKPVYLYSKSDKFNFDFDFDNKKFIITVPVGSFLVTGLKYYECVENQKAVATIELDFPANVDGINVLVYKIQEKEFAILNFKEFSSNRGNSNLLVVGTCGFYGTGSVNATGDYLVNGFKDSNLSLIGTLCSKDFIDFQFKNNKIVLGSSSFVFFNNQYYSVTGTEIAVDNMNKDGIYGMWYDITSKKIEVYHYTAYKTINFKSKIFLGSFWSGSVKKAQIMGAYKVDGVLQQAPAVTLPKYSETDNRLVIPDIVYFMKDDELAAYKSSFIPNMNAIDNMKISLNYVKNNIPRFKYFYEDIVLKESELPSTFSFNVRQYNTSDLYYKNVIKKSIDPTTITNKTPTILHIGDSLTNRKVAYWNNSFLTEKGLTPKFVGTINNLGDMKGEGREGWSYSNFVGRSSTRIDGSVITIQTSGTTSDISKNPFLRLATDNDKANNPKWCFKNTGAKEEVNYYDDKDKTGDFYIFDFSNYLQTYNIDTPDIITIALSTNDINTLTTWWKNSCKLGLEIMYKQIRSALPNVKIGIVPAPAWSFKNANSIKAYEWIEECITQIAEYQKTDDKLFIVPAWCFINRDWSNKLKDATDLSSINNSKKTSLADSIHYSELGEQQYGLVMSRFCANMLD